MALFKCSIRKAVNDAGGAFKWSNTWYVDTLSPLTAASIATNIWTQGERLFHKSRVFAYEVYVTSTLAGDEAFYTAAIDGDAAPGLLVSAGDQLPLFNVVRVDLNVIAGGRPSRKFYRPTIEEGDQTNGNLTNTTLIQAIGTGLGMILAMPEVRDEDGNTFGTSVIKGITSRRLGKFAAVAVPPVPTS